MRQFVTEMWAGMMMLGRVCLWESSYAATSATNMRISRGIARKASNYNAGRFGQAIIPICGLGHYELSINGRRVGNHEMDPGWTNYHKTCLYSSCTGRLKNSNKRRSMRYRR